MADRREVSMAQDHTITVGEFKGPKPSQVSIWLEAIRPFSFTASITPVLIGSVMGAMDGPFSFQLFFLALFGSLFIHIGTNLINDYYDYVNRVDILETEGPNLAGPSLIIQRGLLRPQEVYWGGVGAFTLGSALGFLLVYFCGWPILAIGLASVLAGYFYTANPVSLAYIALGESTVFIFMGPVMVVGAYYVQRQSFALDPFLLSLPIGCLVAAILQANNIRDLETDKQRGKHTLATVIGRRVATFELAGLVYGAYLITIALILLGHAPWPVLLTLVTLPHAIPVVRTAFSTTDMETLDTAVLSSAKLHLEFGLLLIVGLMGSWLLI
jgi:1,4-dihydroxy-2-naphthoate octaprenyltransferase